MLLSLTIVFLLLSLQHIHKKYVITILYASDLAIIFGQLIYLEGTDRFQFLSSSRNCEGVEPTVRFCLYLSEREDTKKKLIQQIFRGDLFPNVHRMHSGRKFDFYRLTNGTGCADSISFWFKSRKNTESFQWPDSRDKR